MSHVGKILIVDDDHRMCNSLKVFFGNEGYEVQTTDNGRKALEALITDDFDVVLLDLVLPDITGTEIMDHISRRTPETCAIVITGYASWESAAESLKKGAFDYLAKPFDLEKLSRTVGNAFKEKALKRETKRDEEAPAKSRKKYRRVFENMPDVYYEVSIDGVILKLSSSIEEVSEYSREELIGTSVCDMYEQAKQRLELVKKLQKKARVSDYEILLKDKDGSQACCLTNAMLIRDEQSRPAKIVGWLRNITERLRVEEGLQKAHEELERRVREQTVGLVKANQQLRLEMKEREKAEEKYKTLVESSITGIFIHQDGKYVFVNDRFAEIHGYEPEALIGMEHSILIHPDEREPLRQIAKKRLEGAPVSPQYEVQRLRKDGTTIWCKMMATCIEYRGRPAIMGNIIDISERKRALAAVRQRDETLSGIISSMTDSMNLIDDEYNIAWANSFSKQFFGADLVGKKCYSVYHRRGKACGSCVVTECFEDAKVHDHEEEVIGKNGARMIFWCTASVAAWRSDGRPKLVVKICRDVTDRKLAEEALRESTRRLEVSYEKSVTYAQELRRNIAEHKRVEEALWESEQKYSTLIENSLTGIYIDSGGKIVFANNRFAEIYKYPKDELIGMESWKLVHPEDRVWTDEIRAKRLKGEDAPPEYEARSLTKYGETIWLTRRNTRIEYEGKPAILGNVVTITERKKAQEQLVTYHEKLRSLASKLSLAEERQRRRVAIEVHDRISQNMAFIKMKLGSARALTRSRHLAGTIDEMVELADETIQNTRSLISELGSPILYELGFVPAVEWLTQQVQRQCGIVLDFVDDGQRKPVSEEVGVLLFQAVRELLVNIVKHAQASRARVSISRRGYQLRVDVEDDGVGFNSAEICPTLHSTGRFGLFSIQERLNPLGGHMEVESESGRGTRVNLKAPLKQNRENKKDKVP